MMNLETGELKSFDFKEELIKALEKEQGKAVQIDPKEATRKQLEEMKVSLMDHKSNLGKILTEERKKKDYSKLNKNQKRNLRKKLNK